MKIVEEKYQWGGDFGNRVRTDYIIIHHRAGDGDAQSLHNIHLGNGWAGIGYHFYVRKDGTIYRGRPIDAVGAHCTGKNCVSVGVCFEGSYHIETKMPKRQKESGRELISYLKRVFKCAEIKCHSDFTSTECPGRCFPLEYIVENAKSEIISKVELKSANDIIWELIHGRLGVEIEDVDRAVEALKKAKNENSSLYWILRKLVNN